MRYKVIISAQIDVEADSENEAIINAKNKIELNKNWKFTTTSSLLQFDAILDEIQDEFTEQELVDEVKQYRKDKSNEEPNTNEC